MECGIEIFLDGKWGPAAVFEPYAEGLGRGHEGPARLQYDVDYAVLHQGQPDAELVPGLDVSFELFQFHDGWPAFLLDLLPGGAGRQAWLKRLEIPQDGPHADWDMLTRGAGSPPGNLRIAEAVQPPPAGHFRPGFPRIDIIEKRQNFLDYAEERGAHVAGATSVQGEAPKLLLIEDYNGMFHAEGSLPDEMAKKFWLVKFHRGRGGDPRNHLVLENEGPYYQVAKVFGVRTGEPLIFDRGALFVPRFDRIVHNGAVDRCGMHSLYAIAGIGGFGATVRHEVFCDAIAGVVDDPAGELREYLLRDILNLALGNTDNHGRNTAILRRQGRMTLAPLYDFAPMFLDPAGISRVTRWDAEPPGEQPDWKVVADNLGDYLDPKELRAWFRGLAVRVGDLPETMLQCGVSPEIVDRLKGWIAAVATGLERA